MPSKDISRACSILRQIIVQVLADFNAEQQGYVLRPVCIERTTEEQQAEWAKGRTAPGKIVTKIDGVHQKSAHQWQASHGEYGVHAIDLGVFTGWEGDAKYLDNIEDPKVLALYNYIGNVAHRYGLAWGGDLWKSFTDRPHVQCLPEI